MKKLFFVMFILLFCLISAQKNEKYLRIDYSSICCGTPSEKPLMDYLKDFSQKNKLKNFEIWLETGLGLEGEFALFIGIDHLNDKQKKKLISGLKTLVVEFENKRNTNHDGNIQLNEEFVPKDAIIKKQNKPTDRFSKLVLYNTAEIK